MNLFSNPKKSIQEKFRPTIWRPFIKAIKKYNLLQENDNIAICISGGKDSMLLAMLFKQLQKFSDFAFNCKYIIMDPGYDKVSRQKILSMGAFLDIEINIFDTDIFEIVQKQEKSPCYLCARMRRGYLYSHAQKLGCNKIALGHHMSDVLETLLMNIFYGSKIETMPPKLKSKNFQGMELIRPMYGIHEDDIIKWRDYNKLEFINCACPLYKMSKPSLRANIKELLKTLKIDNKNIEASLFNAIHNVNISQFPLYSELHKKQ